MSGVKVVVVPCVLELVLFGMEFSPMIILIFVKFLGLVPFMAILDILCSDPGM